MLSKRAITLCNIILQLIIITKKMHAIIGGLRSGGLKSGGLLSCGLMSGGLKSAHREMHVPREYLTCGCILVPEVRETCGCYWSRPSQGAF